MTFSLHSRFIEAAKCDSYSRRLSQVLSYVMMGHLAERHRQHTRKKSKTDFLDPPAGPAATFTQPEDARDPALPPGKRGGEVGQEPDDRVQPWRLLRSHPVQGGRGDGGGDHGHQVHQRGG